MTNETKELKTYTMRELYKQPLEPVEYLVDGLLAPGLYILGGSPKVGKSWMALQLCLAVCDGKGFLGRKTKQCEVLYLALEDGPQRLHSRALRLADTAPSGLHLCHRAAPICCHCRHNRHWRHESKSKGGACMAYIQQRGERKYKITVCNGYKANGQKRMQARTVDVPNEVPKRGIRQYVMAEAERLEKSFLTGIDQSENTRFEEYANRWLERMAKRYKASTLEGYRRMLEAVYSTIGGLPLCKIRPMVLEELCEELRQRPGRGGKPLSENTVHKYLDAVSAVLQDAVKNDILLYNPAHRVDKLWAERAPQRIPQALEMQKLLQCILREPLLYRVYYLLALSTGLRRGELCALRWRDLHGGNQLLIRHSRSTVTGKGVVESDTKNHRTRVVVLPQLVYDYLGELLFAQVEENNGVCPDDLIFAKNGKPVHPDTFSRHLRKLYDRNGFPKDYHLHTMRHFFATYLLENGTSKQVTADLLGHADTAFLERTYCHPQDTCKEQAAGLLDTMLQPADAAAWEWEQRLLAAGNP